MPVPPRIPFHRVDVDAAAEQAVVDALRSGWLATGPRVAQLERALAAWRGDEWAVATTGCTHALQLLMMALDLQPGDEVLTPALTYASVGVAIHHAGGQVRLVDTEPGTCNLDPNALDAAASPRTRALVALHHGGHPCNLPAIAAWCKHRGIALIEDGAHALEARYGDQPIGRWGMGAAFSFYATKNLTMGEGGMAVGHTPQLQARLRRLRLHGLDQGPYARTTPLPNYDLAEPGLKAAPTEAAAALALAQLPHLGTWWRRRAQLASRYAQALAQAPDLVAPVLPSPGTTSAHHLMVVRLNLPALRIGRDELAAQLLERGIQTSLHYKPLSELSWFRQQGLGPASVPNTTSLWPSLLSLPLYPSLTDAELDQVATTLLERLRAHQR